MYDKQSRSTAWVLSLKTDVSTPGTMTGIYLINLRRQIEDFM